MGAAVNRRYRLLSEKILAKIDSYRCYDLGMGIRLNIVKNIILERTQVPYNFIERHSPILTSELEATNYGKMVVFGYEPIK